MFDLVTLTPTVFGPSARVDGADFLATKDFGVGFVAGVEELRWMAAGLLTVKVLAGGVGSAIIDEAL